MIGVAENNDANPATHFGRQMRKERIARGWTLREFSARTGVNFGNASRIENGRRPPTETVADACDAVFPDRKGWFREYYEESKSWMPAGFRSWGEHEDRAVTLRIWSPGILHGLVQTEDYAAAFLRTYPGATDEMVATRLKARMERQQRVLFRDDDPPEAWFVLDELSLYRRVVSPDVMARQTHRLVQIARQPNVTLQILPAVEHPANPSELIVTDSAAYVEHLAGGLVYADAETVSSLTRIFSTILSESYRASESLKILEGMAEAWMTGVSPRIRVPTEDRA